jgi:hypothetical protein
MRRAWKWAVPLAVAASILTWSLFLRPDGPNEPPHAFSRSRDPSAATPQPAVRPKELVDAASSVPPEVAADSIMGAGPTPDSASGIIPEIRAVLTEDPKLAEQLARADQVQFPDSPDADERDALLVAAVYNQKDPLRARLETRRYLRRHPGGRFAEQLMHVTGATMPVPTASSSSR